MTTLINLFGSSSAGKSSLMADLFVTLKQNGHTVEMCPEIVKQWVWSGLAPNKYDQYYLLGHEIRQQSRLLNKVEYVISDSPALQNAFYNWHLNGNDYLLQPVKDYYTLLQEDGHTIANFFLERNKPFEKVGRYQTEEESDKIAESLIQYIIDRDFQAIILKGKDHERTENLMYYI